MFTVQVSRFHEVGKKIVAFGLNYRDHAKEMNLAIPKEPVVFLKPTTSYLTEGQPIKLPKGLPEIHYEVELGVIIGKLGKSISERNVLDHIGGYCLALDMTDRIGQSAASKAGMPWELFKGFDTSCPVSAFIPREKIPDPQNIDLWLKVNGVFKQRGNTRDMIFSIGKLIGFVSEHFTLEPGDLLLTGTPAGVGPVRSGDIIECGLGGNLVNMKFDVVGK